MIHLLKYGKRPSLAKRLGRMMSILVLRDPLLSRAELVVPVPLHSARQRERGYNQSELLASALAESLGIRLVKNALVRRKNTKSQTGLTPEQRMRNVADAFEVKKPDTLKGKKVLLVDDVMTTGSTLRFCAEALLGAGADKVFGITCAVVLM
jgi:ComF family protein